jgi:hypothetical protein
VAAKESDGFVKFTIAWGGPGETQEFDRRTFNTWAEAYKHADADVRWPANKRVAFAIVDADDHEPAEGERKQDHSRPEPDAAWLEWCAAHQS